MWVIAPTRHGAHNWEGIGSSTALRALQALRLYMAKLSSLNLPQVLEGGGLLAGHSMGGHGAWVTGASQPDLFSCLSVGSSWINKEEYGQANAFFELDVQISYVDSGMYLDKNFHLFYN